MRYPLLQLLVSDGTPQIKIGRTVPFSGRGSAYAGIGKTQTST
jgi:hypothetical protein